MLTSVILNYVGLWDVVLIYVQGREKRISYEIRSILFYFITDTSLLQKPAEAILY